MSNHRKKKLKNINSATRAFKAVFFTLLVCALSFLIYQRAAFKEAPEDGEIISDGPSDFITPPISEQAPPDVTDADGAGDDAPEASPALPDFLPYHIDSTDPGNFLASTGIIADGAAVESHALNESINFGYGADYSAIDGIITFRGNNFRDTAAFGYANLKDESFSHIWTAPTGSLTAPDGAYWSGSGWTGQPLIVKWPKSTREVMNMYDWAKEKDELVEVICASMDGNIYFMELGTGSKTRDTLTMGYTFKGAGALDPRGYPILYAGSGYDSYRGASRVFIISLIDCSVMYEFGNNDEFSLRGSLSYFDSSPLVDAQTDQLIYPGENGILYMMKLNTVYDEAAGNLSINPSDVVKWRYDPARDPSQYWIGFEDSAVIWRGYIIMSDNGGNLICLDLNTLEVAWVQDVLDDTNCTPVLELENGHPYIYTSTSFRAGLRAGERQTADVPIWKIDAVTGEIVWQYDYSCHTETGVSGGVQGTLAIGKNDLSDLIFVPVARTPSAGAGVLAALNKHTGEVVWERQFQIYSWSSPVAVYDSDGKGYLVFCSFNGYMYLIDGLTGDILDDINLGSNLEASPVVYNNMVVIGTRENGIWGVAMS